MHQNSASAFGDSPDSPPGYAVVLLDAKRAGITYTEEPASGDSQLMPTVGIEFLSDLDTSNEVKKRWSHIQLTVSLH